VLLLQVLAGVFTFAEIELNPLSKNLMGMPHSKVRCPADPAAWLHAEQAGSERALCSPACACVLCRLSFRASGEAVLFV
jgi:hypothetical protein